MRHTRQVALAVLALALTGSSVAAQARPGAQQRPAQRAQSAPARTVWEIGGDAALTFGLDDPGFTLLQIPASVRWGFFLNPSFSVEPYLAYRYLKVEGADGDAVYHVGVGGLYHLSPDRTRSQLFLRPFLGIVGTAGGTDDSNLGIGFGFGFKLPKLAGRLVWRGEANLMFVDGDESFNLLFGASYFPR